MEIRQQMINPSDSGNWVSDAYKFFMRDLNRGYDIIAGEDLEIAKHETVLILQYKE